MPLLYSNIYYTNQMYVSKIILIYASTVTAMMRCEKRYGWTYVPWPGLLILKCFFYITNEADIQLRLEVAKAKPIIDSLSVLRLQCVLDSTYFVDSKAFILLTGSPFYPYLFRLSIYKVSRDSDDVAVSDHPCWWSWFGTDDRHHISWLLIGWRTLWAGVSVPREA